MNRAYLISFVLAGALLVGGCVTRTPERDRSYISIENQTYEREGCAPVRGPVEGRSLHHAMTRDRLPGRIALIPLRTYSYGTQIPLPHRPSANRPLCLVVIREKDSWVGPVESVIGLEMEAVDDQTVRLTVNRIDLDSSALWKEAPPQIDVVLAFGLIGDEDLNPDQLISRGELALGAVRLGEDWRRPWQDPDPDRRSIMLGWPSDRSDIRLLAVIGERRHGRARPDPAVMDLQVATILSKSLDWPPAR